MKLAIMQPYLFPYIGYFQLIACCDRFVIHDDVQYIKGGWINRNRILINGKPDYITLPLRKDSSFLNINRRSFTSEFELEKAGICRRVESAYRKAPFFDEAFELIRACFSSTEENVSLFITETIKRCCDYLGIATPMTVSSSLRLDDALQGEERVIAINKALGADHYINPIGGLELYKRESFAEHGIKLHFIKTRDMSYPQFTESFVPFLSIIDVMMFNSRTAFPELLKKHDLMEAVPSSVCAG